MIVARATAAAVIVGLAACGSSSDRKGHPAEPAAAADTAAAAPEQVPEQKLEGSRVSANDAFGRLAPAPGTFIWQAAGCLEQGSRSDKDGEAFPPAVATRGRPGADALTARAVPHGFVTSHAIPHACCLDATTQVRLVDPSKRIVHIDEILTGTPCRCMCQSTLSVAVGVDPGTWSIEVTLRDRDQAPVSQSTSVVVEAPKVLERP